MKTPKSQSIFFFHVQNAEFIQNYISEQIRKKKRKKNIELWGCCA